MKPRYVDYQLNRKRSPLDIHKSFEDLLEDADERWLDKARRLQARRWRKLKQGLI